jgi:translation initiation factor 2 gamma subunit (eIF-2gamma)
MKTTHTERSIKFIEWLSAEDMHSNSKEWLSELEFIKDEHLFFEDLIKSFTLQLIDKKNFSDNRKVIKAINSSSKENEILIKVVSKHENNLTILVDGIDQPKAEQVYRDEHRNLTVIVHKFSKDFKQLKLKLFDIIKNIKKTEKQKHLLS